MRLFGRRRRPGKTFLAGTVPEMADKREARFEELFARHMTRYTGQTVTIFVKAGGASGLGFTGILLLVNGFYAQLLSRIGPAPGCAIYSACSITSIPISKIASFVHNAL